MVQKEFKDKVKEGIKIPIYNPIVGAFTDMLVTRVKEGKINVVDMLSKNMYKSSGFDYSKIIKVGKDIKKANKPDEDQVHIKNDYKITKKEYVRSKDDYFIEKSGFVLQNYQNIIDLPKNGGYYLDSSSIFEDSSSDKIIDLQTINKKKESQTEKIYDYYYPPLKLERGVISKEAIRSKRRLTKKLIRAIFPPKSTLSQNWVVLFFVKSHYHSMEGNPVMIPIYMNRVIKK